MPQETLRSQIDCVLSDIGADVVKTGMLPSAEVGSSPKPDPSQLPLRQLHEEGFAMCPALAGHWALPPCSVAINASSQSLRQPVSQHTRCLACFLELGESYRQIKVRIDRVSGLKETFLQVVEVVAEQCRAHQVSTLVVDPVLVSTSGHSLGDSRVAAALKERSAGFPCLTCPCPSTPCLTSLRMRLLALCRLVL